MSIFYGMAHIYHADCMVNWFQASQRAKPTQDKNNLFKKSFIPFDIMYQSAIATEQNDPQTKQQTRSLYHSVPGLQLSWIALLQAAGLLISWCISAPNVCHPPRASSDRRMRESPGTQDCSKPLLASRPLTSHQSKQSPQPQPQSRGMVHRRPWRGCGCGTLSQWSEALGGTSNPVYHSQKSRLRKI